MNAARTNARPWTTRRLLDWTSRHFEQKGVADARLSAELLLAHVLEVPRIKLYMELDRPASPLELSAYRDLVEKAVAHHPVQYLLGEAHFFSLTFKVTADTLIPRPSTETLVEHIIHHTRVTPGFRAPQIAEIGTGSGIIAVSLAKNLPDAHIVATDISEPALAVARQNAERHGVADRIEFRAGSLYEPLHGHLFHYVVSNPPYIPDAEWEQVAANVRDYEPTAALRAGAEGLDVLRPLIAGGAAHLQDPGQLVLEIAASQKAAVLELAGQAKGLERPRVLADHEAHPRMLLADRSATPPT